MVDALKLEVRTDSQCNPEKNYYWIHSFIFTIQSIELIVNASEKKFLKKKNQSSWTSMLYLTFINITRSKERTKLETYSPQITKSHIQLIQRQPFSLMFNV